MKKSIYLLYILSYLTLITPNTIVYGQNTAEYNFGNHWIHPSTLKETNQDFLNESNAVFTNNGTVWFTHNFINKGTFNYDNKLEIYPGLTRFQGNDVQSISGTGNSIFFNILFSGVSFNLNQNIVVHNQIDFDKGIINAKQSVLSEYVNVVQMKAGSSYFNASDFSHVNGFVEKEGNTEFTFPIGNEGYYRPIKISASLLDTDIFSARYIRADPSMFGYERSIKSNDVGLVSDQEFWILKKIKGISNPQITLYWDKSTSATLPTDITKIQVVRWDGTKWINETRVSYSGDSDYGTITANVSGYGVFTIAAVESKVVAVNDTLSMIQNTTLNGIVYANDTVTTGSNIWSLVSNSEHGILNINTNGTFTYSPFSGYVGSDLFIYKLSDIYGNVSEAKVYIDVKPISQYILVEKTSTTPVLQNNGEFIWKYNITLTNLQPVLVDSVHVVDVLTNVFKLPITYTVTSIVATGKLIPNTLYDGNIRTDLLLDVSRLDPLKKDTITIEVKVNPHQYVGTVYNQAVFDATLDSNVKVNDILTDDPTNTTSTDLYRPTKTDIAQIDLFIPDAFTPNNDGINDYFVIVHPADLKLSIEVFNRWGIRVYRNDNYQNDWDGKGTGTFLGSNLLDGTYYYIIKTKDTTKNILLNYSGFITLKR